MAPQFITFPVKASWKRSARPSKRLLKMETFTRWSALSVFNREKLGKYPLKHGWTRLTCQAVHNDEQFAQSHSFIYPLLKINNKRPVIHNREEVEEFLTKNLTVPHDRQNLLDNCDSKNLEKISQDYLVAMYEDMFDMEEPFDLKETRIQKYKVTRQTFLKAKHQSHNHSSYSW